MFLEQPDSQFRHGDGGPSLDGLDQERLIRRQLAASRRTALTVWCRRAEVARSFELACAQNDIDHRLTKAAGRPWTNGQVERMNRTLKDATVRRYYYDTHDQLQGHLGNFLAAYNFALRLKTLRGLTPYEYICKIWTSEPQRFRLDPLHQMPGLNI